MSIRVGIVEFSGFRGASFSDQDAVSPQECDSRMKWGGPLTASSGWWLGAPNSGPGVAVNDLSAETSQGRSSTRSGHKRPVALRSRL